MRPEKKVNINADGTAIRQVATVSFFETIRLFRDLTERITLSTAPANDNRQAMIRDTIKTVSNKLELEVEAADVDCSYSVELKTLIMA